MPTIEDLYAQLRVAAALLDGAAAQIRDIPLAPARDNIRHIGAALASVFEVMRSIEAVRSDLAPEWVSADTPEVSEANRRLTAIMCEAISLVEGGRRDEASRILSDFATTEPSALHQQIAAYEAARVKG